MSPARGAARTLLLGLLFDLSYALGTPGYDVPALPFVCLDRRLREGAEAEGLTVLPAQRAEEEDRK